VLFAASPRVGDRYGRGAGGMSRTRTRSRIHRRRLRSSARRRMTHDSPVDPAHDSEGLGIAPSAMLGLGRRNRRRSGRLSALGGLGGTWMIARRGRGVRLVVAKLVPRPARQRLRLRLGRSAPSRPRLAVEQANVLALGPRGIARMRRRRPGRPRRGGRLLDASSA